MTAMFKLMDRDLVGTIQYLRETVVVIPIKWSYLITIEVLCLQMIDDERLISP